MVDQAAPASRLDQLVGAFASPNASPQNGTQAPGLPEYPCLAENIELMGEMKESAFKEAPWLISRNGKFLQVTRLLHKVAEHATGDRTMDEIGQAVTADYDREVNKTNKR